MGERRRGRALGVQHRGGIVFGPSGGAPMLRRTLVALLVGSAAGNKLVIEGGSMPPHIVFSGPYDVATGETPQCTLRFLAGQLLSTCPIVTAVPPPTSPTAPPAPPALPPPPPVAPQ